MAIHGQKREPSNFQKSVGIFEAKVIAFNPSREELSEILGAELENENEYFNPEYEIKDENDNVIGVAKRLTVSVWLQDVVSENKYNVRFYLLDRNRKDRNGVKYQYINKQGVTSWAADVSEFDVEKYDWFRNPGGIRVAKVGENNFYEFLRSWLLIDFKNDREAELSLDWDRLMRNDVRELRDAMNTDLAGTVVCLATVRSGEDGEEHQSVYNGRFLPGSFISAFKNKGRKPSKFVEKFIKEVTDPEHGCRDFYVMDLIQPYNPEQNVAAGDAVHIQGGTPAPRTGAPVDDISF